MRAPGASHSGTWNSTNLNRFLKLSTKNGYPFFAFFVAKVGKHESMIPHKTEMRVLVGVDFGVVMGCFAHKNREKSRKIDEDFGSICWWQMSYGYFCAF